MQGPGPLGDGLRAPAPDCYRIRRDGLSQALLDSGRLTTARNHPDRLDTARNHPARLDTARDRPARLTTNRT
ncbi:hypothetical protein ABZ865_13960 [Streptomyces sp. NPDC047085]|uniref:hypothetical protein n=1 Tax=Streptomyces sp. NPDC047085 TaxID=3155140 RepID=UPI0033F681F6